LKATKLAYTHTKQSQSFVNTIKYLATTFPWNDLLPKMNFHTFISINCFEWNASISYLLSEKHKPYKIVILENCNVECGRGEIIECSPSGQKTGSAHFPQRQRWIGTRNFRPLENCFLLEISHFMFMRRSARAYSGWEKKPPNRKFLYFRFSAKSQSINNINCTLESIHILVCKVDKRGRWYRSKRFSFPTSWQSEQPGHM
jgi:hypothetical protein